MLFSSAPFLFAFLPLAVALTALAARLGGAKAAMAVLVLLSLVFYGWHRPEMVAPLGLGMALNYGLGLRLRSNPSPVALALGVGANLAALGWFKYAGFFAGIAAALSGASVSVPAMALPLAISFFTFQQIAWLVDCAKGRTERLSPLDYALFVAFFPQLLAGPITRADETPPQFRAEGAFRIGRADILAGLALLAMGLFKKAALADGLAPYANAVFDASGRAGFADSWGGAMAYTLQIYFDFSGLADMALGAARLVGIRLPANFDSPYKSASLSEFWRRWHMTLSRFLRDYLYIPLGGSRFGPGRQAMALMTTMVLGGLWHGAGWTFIAWGVIHGGCLAVNHAWKRLRPQSDETLLGRVAGVGLTLAVVTVAWVFFRASGFAEAWGVLSGMAGAHGWETPGGALLDEQAWAWIAVLLAVVWLLPNSLDWLEGFAPALGAETGRAGRWLSLRAAVWAPMIAVWGVIAVLIILHRGANTAAFLYMVF